MEAVSVAIVGVDRYTDLLIKLLCGSDRFRLSAICESRRDVLRQQEQQGRTCQLFDDPRELILRSGAQLLIVWRGSGHEEFLKLAVDQGLWLLLRTAGEAPLGFSNRLIHRADEGSVGVFAWSPWLFVPSFESVADWLTEQEIRSILVRFSVCDRNLDWPSLDNPLRALMYPSVLLAQWWRGLPESVFCQEVLRSEQTSATPIQYHCMLNMRYDGAVAMVSASLNAGPDRHAVWVHGSGGTIEAEWTGARWYDVSGQLISSSAEYTREEAHEKAYERCLEAVWQAYQERQRNAPFDLRRRLGVMAVLDAAALSVRTGYPEELVKVASRELD